MSTPIEFNKTVGKKITNYGFDDLPLETLDQMYKDGRPVSYPLEFVTARDYGLTYIPGCKGHDFVDSSNNKYDQKGFTKNGCEFMPSSMIGARRTFDKDVFDEKVKDMIYVIVSVINFPEIKTRFVKGSELAGLYPNGKISLKDHDKFFELTSQ
jgi:hypothetical protein